MYFNVFNIWFDHVVEYIVISSTWIQPKINNLMYLSILQTKTIRLLRHGTHAPVGESAISIGLQVLIAGFHILAGCISGESTFTFTHLNDDQLLPLYFLPQ